MAEQPTCGKGLASNAVLPERLGNVAAALGAILEAHIPSLDPADERSRKEREVYQRLAEDCTRASTQLEAIAQQMFEARDLPMGRHDQAALGSPSVLHSFRSFVQSEEDLLTLLQSRLGEDQQLLAAMGAPGRRPP